MVKISFPWTKAAVSVKAALIVEFVPPLQFYLAKP